MHFMCINTTESGVISPTGSLDISLWNCSYVEGHKPLKKNTGSPNEKFISFCAWDFAGDVSNAIKFLGNPTCINSSIINSAPNLNYSAEVFLEQVKKFSATKGLALSVITILLSFLNIFPSFC